MTWEWWIDASQNAVIFWWAFSSTLIVSQPFSPSTNKSNTVFATIPSTSTHSTEVLLWSGHKINQEINVKEYPSTLMLRLWKALWSLAFSMGLRSLAWYGAVPRITAPLWGVYKIMDNCWLIGWSDTFIKCLNHEIAVSTVIVIPVALCCPWNFIFSTQEHLRWMIQKDSLGQDIFLLGHVQIRVCGDGRGSFIKTLLPAISGSRWMDWAFK